MKCFLFAIQFVAAFAACLEQVAIATPKQSGDPTTNAVFSCTDPAVMLAPYVWKRVTNGSSPMIEATMPGAYLRTVVQGTTSIGIVVDGMANIAGSTNFMPTIAYAVDAGEFHTVSLTKTNGVYTLPLVTGLDAGKPHQLDLYFRAATLQDFRWTQSTAHVRLIGLVLGSGGSLQLPPVRSKRVIAYGDSITEGVGAEGLFTSWSEIGVNNACITWVPIACAALDCEYGQLGSGGWAMLNTALAIPPLTRSWDKYDALTSRLENGSLRPEPDYAFCLMGTNDGDNSSRFVTFYVNWLVAMRTACPNTRIFCVIPPLGVHDSQIKQAVTTRNDAGDLRVHLIDTAPLKYGYRAGQGATLFGYDGVHPSEYGHAILGAFIAVEAQKVIGNDSQASAPSILTTSPDFGIKTNRFGFDIAWAAHASVVVEASTNAMSPLWTPVATNTLSGGAVYFSDPEWTNHPARFYRVRSP